jgi:hypothetical protein
VNATQQASFAPDDGDSGDRFGFPVTVSSDGSTALVGARNDEDPNGQFAGSVYVFGNSGGSWTQQAKLAANDGDSHDNFGISIALSNDGTTALIGASNDDDPNGGGPNGMSGAGSAYVFSRLDQSWSQQAKLAPADGDSDDDFGLAVALSSDGTTALIGDRGDDDPNGEDSGSAYVFEREGASWNQQAKLTPEDGDSDDWFGLPIALSNDGTTALIGAYFDEDPNGEEAGSAYVFNNAGGSWSQQAKLVAADGDSNDWFGLQIALSGDGTTALIGASNDEDPNGEHAGSAYIFHSGGGSWDQQEKLTPEDGNSDDHFGLAVSLSSDGTTALVGAPSDEDPNGQEGGAAYIYDSANGSWSQETKFAAAEGDNDDNFGLSVTISEDDTTVLVGAPRDEVPNGENAGSAYVFIL